ncbi:MAG: HNH endonuclease [Nitrososphaerales archaeon]
MPAPRPCRPPSARLLLRGFASRSGRRGVGDGFAYLLATFCRSGPVTPSAPVNQYQRASRAWPVLTKTAALRKTLTYAELAARLRIHPRPIRFVLGEIQDYCLDAKLPPLTILVVNKRTHHPGAGFIAWDVDDWENGLPRVYDYPWQDRPNPFAFAQSGSTPEALAKRLVSKPEDAEVVYRRIRDRGYAQLVFRLALLRAYGQRCAFCGLSLRDALQAAHIVPWSEASSGQRVRPSNGLLLCSTHHALFDAHIMSVDLDRKIICDQNRLPGHRWTEIDNQISTSLHGHRIILPEDRRHCPSRVSLRRRANLFQH